MRRGSRRLNRSRQGGFTYFGVIIAVLLIGMALAAAGVVARTAMQREREAQLLWVGAQYRNALTKFFNQNGGRLPQDLKELVLDESTPVPRPAPSYLPSSSARARASWPMAQAQCSADSPWSEAEARQESSSNNRKALRQSTGE